MIKKLIIKLLTRIIFDIIVSKQLVRHIRIFVDDYLKSINRESFFQKYDYEMVDMIGSLIILPLRKKNTEN